MSYEGCDACQGDVTNESRVYLCLPCAAKTYIPVLACEHAEDRLWNLGGGLSWCSDCGAMHADGYWHRPGVRTAGGERRGAPPGIVTRALVSAERSRLTEERDEARELLRRAVGVITDAQKAIAGAGPLLDAVAVMR